MRHVALADLDLSELVRAGDTVSWGQACAEPLSLTEVLVAQRQRIGRFRVFTGTAFSRTLQPEHADAIELIGPGGVGPARSFAKRGAFDALPLHTSVVDALIRRGAVRVDVVLVQVSRPNASGEYSLGLASDWIRSAVDRARVVVAEASDRVPFSVCDEPLREPDIDVLVETSRAPVEAPPAPFGEVEGRIARHVLEYVPDGATLEIGIGAIPEAVLAGLADRRELGIHSGLIGDRVADLVEAGVVTNERKGIDRGVTVAGLLIGTRRLYDFVDRNPAVRMAGVPRTHGFGVLSGLHAFVALNSALEVDVTGQVNGEAIGGDHLGLVGGQVDFLRAANASEGGCGIVALPSTAGAASRIVARLSGPVSAARSDVGVVVTEHGAADLRGASVRERTRRMLAIADPAYRDALERAARDLD